MTSSHVFAKHTQKAVEWVNSVDSLLGWRQKNHALDALRIVLHEIRDHLPPSEVAHLSAQLPLVIRGLYFEGWQPSQTPVKYRHKEAFVHSVRDSLIRYIRCPFDDGEAERVIHAVFHTLALHLDQGEWEKLYFVFPKGIKSFIL